MWQWWWWRLDHTAGASAECFTRNHTLLSNVSNTYQWNDTAYLEYNQGTSDITSPNVQNFAWSSWDVADVYDIGEMEETNISTSSSHDVQGKTTARYSLSNIITRWRVRRVNPKFPASKYRRSDPRPMPSPQTETNSWSGHFTTRRPIPEQMNEGSANAPEGSLILIINCVLGCFIGTALVKLSCSVIRTLWKMKRRVYCGFNCRDQPGEEGEGKKLVFCGYMSTLKTIPISFYGILG